MRSQAGENSFWHTADGWHNPQVSDDLAEVFQRNIRLDGIETGSVRMLEEMLNWFNSKKTKPIINHVVNFEESQQAFQSLKHSNHIG